MIHWEGSFYTYLAPDEIKVARGCVERWDPWVTCPGAPGTLGRPLSGAWQREVKVGFLEEMP